MRARDGFSLVELMVALVLLGVVLLLRSAGVSDPSGVRATLVANTATAIAKQTSCTSPGGTAG